MMKYLAIAATAMLLGAIAIPASAADFKIAVEAADGMQMRAFLVDTTDSLEGADLTKVPISYVNVEPVHQRFMDKFYVIDIPRALDDVVQLCVADISRPIEDAVFECAVQDALAYLPGNEPPVVHFVYDPEGGNNS